jgi:hypothetical protein
MTIPGLLAGRAIRPGELKKIIPTLCDDRQFRTASLPEILFIKAMTAQRTPSVTDFKINLTGNVSPVHTEIAAQPGAVHVDGSTVTAVPHINALARQNIAPAIGFAKSHGYIVIDWSAGAVVDFDPTGK